MSAGASRDEHSDLPHVTLPARPPPHLQSSTAPDPRRPRRKRSLQPRHAVSPPPSRTKPRLKKVNETATCLPVRARTRLALSCQQHLCPPCPLKCDGGVCQVPALRPCQRDQPCEHGRDCSSKASWLSPSLCDRERGKKRLCLHAIPVLNTPENSS